MAYTKTDWENLPSTTTPIIADALDNIENGIENNDERLNGTKPIDNTIYANDFKCKNLFNYSGVASSYYHNGITFTNNGDGTITANGTASGVAYWDLITNIQGIGNYTLSGCPSGGGDNTYKQILMRYSDYNGVDDTGNGATRTFSNGVNYGIRLRIASGYVCNNVVFSPMLELGSAVTTYTPYKNFDNTNHILWTNPSPTSDFETQTITLNDSLVNYAYYEVIFLASKYEYIAISTGKVPSLFSTNLMTLRNANNVGTISRYRDVLRNSATQLNVTTCYQVNAGSTTQTTTNERNIPYQIIGYKN